MEPQGWAGSAAQKRRAGFGTQRLGFDPQTCHFCSLCDRDSMANFSDPWFPSLERWVMITPWYDGWMGRRESNQTVFAPVETCKQEMHTECLLVGLPLSWVGIDLRAGGRVCGVGAGEGKGQEGFREKAGKARPLDHPSANSGACNTPRHDHQVSQALKDPLGTNPRIR